MLPELKIKRLYLCCYVQTQDVDLSLFSLWKPVDCDYIAALESSANTCRRFGIIHVFSVSILGRGC